MKIKKFSGDKINIALVSLLALFFMVILILVVFFSGESGEEVMMTNCYAAESKGTCGELSESMGQEALEECCEKYDKCC
ncbi:MAG: hypothetical protein ACOCZ6_00575 [Nanoarchaeota archaeon]